jgi:acyl-CoA synthetase (AMP-forming)/AMP-acid ligase II
VVIEVPFGAPPRQGALKFAAPGDKGFTVSDAANSDGSALCVIYSTGGTTGRPNGVVHTHSSIIMAAYATMLEAEMTVADRLRYPACPCCRKLCRDRPPPRIDNLDPRWIRRR